MTCTPFIKLPPIYYNQNWHFDETHKKMLQPNHLLHQHHHSLPLILAEQQGGNNNNNNNNSSDIVVVEGGEEDEFVDDDDQISKNSGDTGSPISSYSSSSSVSSFSSVNSVLFNSTTKAAAAVAAAASVNRKGSLASILNSDPELLALEREERLGGYQTYFNANNNNNNNNDVNVSVIDKNNNSNNSNKNISVNNNIILADTANTSIDNLPYNDTTNNIMSNTTTKKRNTPPDSYSLDRKRQRRSQDRQIKGLRLFSKQVCSKVAEKGITTYNEVADELAADIQRNSASYDQKNIRRRVYDALNVLMALDIITKDRKEIKWLGINNCQTATAATSNNNAKQLLQEQILKEESRQRFLSQSIAESKSKLDDTFKQYLCLEKVVQRNAMITTKKVISFPFFVVSSDTSTTKIDESTIKRISPHEFCLSFAENASMMIYRDLEILSRIWRT